MAAQEYFAAIYQDAALPVMVLDERLEIQYCNSAFADLCERMGAEKESFLPHQALQTAKDCMEAMRGDTLSLRLPLGELSVMLAPCFYGEGRYLALHPARVAASVRQEETVRILRNSHDRLLKYLNDIYGVVQQMEDSGERDAIAGGVRRILRMADHLYQALDREGTMEYRVPVPIGGLAEGYLEQFNRLSSQKIRSAIKDRELYARVMPEDLEMILGILLSNAVRFGGEDAILRLKERGEELILSVWDSGKGPEEPERLFEWGWRTVDKKGRKGLGFSLPMAKMLAERQDALLRYVRREGGSSFEIVMKAERLPASTLAEWQPEPWENSLSKLRIELSDL